MATRDCKFVRRASEYELAKWIGLLSQLLLQCSETLWSKTQTSAAPLSGHTKNYAALHALTPRSSQTSMIPTVELQTFVSLGTRVGTIRSAELLIRRPQ